MSIEHYAPPQQQLSAKSCEICGGKLPPNLRHTFNQQTLQVCKGLECQNVLKQKARMPAATFNAYLRSHQQVLKHRQQRLAIRQKFKQEERKENQRIYQLILKQRSNKEDAPEHVVILPSGRSELTPIPEERLETYKSYLKDLINKALKYNSVQQVPNDGNIDAFNAQIQQEKFFKQRQDVKNVSDQFCAVCKGGCCTSGQEHAYHSVSSIRRILDAHPEWDADTLLETYLGYLPEKSISNACVNQGEFGCTVPRELRSNICNKFYCKSIVKFQEKHQQGEALQPVIAIRREDALWDGAHFSRKNEVTEVAVVTEDKIESLAEETYQEAANENS